MRTFVAAGAAAAAAVMLSSAPVAEAVCPNSCSGHGSCGVDDMCTCYSNWQSGDCSLRTCPYDTAWGDVKVDGISGREVHYYAECSGRGICDRQTAMCVCEDSFEGDACQRMTCPGGANCNGHGTCELLSKANPGYDGWDADKVQICSCDPGYAGHGCAMRMCKYGDDPLTADGVDEVQTITLGYVTTVTDSATAQFVLGYKDWRGETWYTRPIDFLSASNTAIKEALLTLPQSVIDDVTVSDAAVTLGKSLTFKVTFSGMSTPGNQPELTLLIDGCVKDGCQPYYTGVQGTGDLTKTVVATTVGTTERAECAARGSCDTETGLCKCYAGFYGEACDKQTLVL